MKKNGSPQHFNKGIVWGKVGEVKFGKTKGGKTGYAMIEISCTNSTHGHAKVFGFLWGQVKTGPFIDLKKNNPHDLFRFDGFFSQHIKKEIRRSNYTFYNFRLAGPEDKSRAVFILTGKVVRIEKQIIELHLERNNGNNIEDFRLEVLDASMLSAIAPGETVQVKGTFSQGEEDFYGEHKFPTAKPLIMEVKLCRK